MHPLNSGSIVLYFSTIFAASNAVVYVDYLMFAMTKQGYVLYNYAVSNQINSTSLVYVYRI